MNAQRSPGVSMDGSGNALKTLFIFDESQVGTSLRMQFLALRLQARLALKIESFYI